MLLSTNEFSNSSRMNLCISNDCMRININRLFYTCICAVIVYMLVFLHALVFDFSGTARQISIFWIYSIIIGTAIILLLGIIWLKRHPNAQLIGHLIQYIAVIVIMFFGLYSTANGYLVSLSAITAYLIACLLIGIILLLRPGIAVLFFSCSYVVYAIINLNALDGPAWLSFMINGLSITTIGCILSIVMWRYNRTNLLQKRRISKHHQQLLKANKQLERMAFYDMLTDLPNRRLFNDILQKEIALIQRINHESCLVMLDIDHFKSVNDQYGHKIGDSLLMEVGGFLSSSVRKCDTLCRLGGEEFIILLPQTELPEAITLADKLRKRLSSHPFSIAGTVLRVTVSAGVTRLTKDPSAAIAQQYIHVDKALYKAKQAGRNCVMTL